MHSDFGHSPLCLASKRTSLSLVKALPSARWKSLRRFPHSTACLTCQKPFSSLCPLLIHLDRQGPWAEFLKPMQGTGKRRTKPGRSWRPLSQGHPMSVSRGELKWNFHSKGLSGDAEARHETPTSMPKQARRKSLPGGRPSVGLLRRNTDMSTWRCHFG